MTGGPGAFTPATRAAIRDSHPRSATTTRRTDERPRSLPLRRAAHERSAPRIPGLWSAVVMNDEPAMVQIAPGVVAM